MMERDDTEDILVSSRGNTSATGIQNSVTQTKRMQYVDYSYALIKPKKILIEKSDLLLSDVLKRTKRLNLGKMLNY